MLTIKNRLRKLERAHFCFWQSANCRDFRSSLRDFLFIRRSNPGLKAWAIFRGPSGTAQRLRCAQSQYVGPNQHTHSIAPAASFSPFNSFNAFGPILTLVVLISTGCTPAGPNALLQGEKLFQKGRYSQAIEKLKVATTLIPTNAQAWNYLGLAYHYAHRADDAEKTYRRALLLDHDLSEVHYNLGSLYLEEKKNDAAKTEFYAYTLRRANSLDALLKLGTAQLRLNEFSPAEKTFQDALRLSPQSPEALNGLGCIRARQRGRANEAVGYFRAALKSQTNYAPAVLNWAIVAQQQSQDKRFALQKYREYLSLTPPAENVQAVKAIAFQLEQELAPPAPPAKSAVQIATNAHQSESLANKAPPNLPAKPATNISRTAQPVAQHSSNVDTVKLAPEPVVKPVQELSSSTAPTGSHPVDTDSSAAPSASRIQAEALFAEARRAQQAHRLADAINSYRAAAQQDPTYFEAYYNLAVALAESGNLPGAIDAYRSALAIRPDSLDAGYNLALVFRDSGDYGKATSEFEKLLEKHPNDTRSHLALGNLYAQQLHQPAKARAHYLKVLENDPHNPQAANIRFWLTSNP
jgi:Flp pilus assembly protein TadD